MGQIIELFVSAIILLTGIMVVAVVWGADPQIATALFEGAVRMLVYLFVIALLASVFASIMKSI